MRPSDSQSDGKIEGGGEFINDAQSAMISDYELFSFEFWKLFWILYIFEFFQRTFCFDFVLVKSYSISWNLIAKLLKKSSNFTITKLKIDSFLLQFSFNTWFYWIITYFYIFRTKSCSDFFDIFIMLMSVLSIKFTIW